MPDVGFRIDRVSAAAAVLVQTAFFVTAWMLVTGPFSGANVTPGPEPPPAFVVPLVLELAFPGNQLAMLPGSPLQDHLLLIALVNLPFWYALFAGIRAAMARRRRSAPVVR